jgi:hypothetical protein
MGLGKNVTKRCFDEVPIVTKSSTVPRGFPVVRTVFNRSLAGRREAEAFKGLLGQSTEKWFLKSGKEGVFF